MGVVLWLMSPAVVLAAVGVVGICGVLLIGWGLVHREPYESRQMDQAYWASQRRSGASRPPLPRRSHVPGRGTSGGWPRR